MAPSDQLGRHYSPAALLAHKGTSNLSRRRRRVANPHWEAALHVPAPISPGGAHHRGSDGPGRGATAAVPAATS